jgi:hypothetical protein
MGTEAYLVVMVVRHQSYRPLPLLLSPAASATATQEMISLYLDDLHNSGQRRADICTINLAILLPRIGRLCLDLELFSQG